MIGSSLDIIVGLKQFKLTGLLLSAAIGRRLITMKWTLPGQRVRIRQQTLQLTSSLSRWCQVREDLIYACRNASTPGWSSRRARRSQPL
jgi:hypothetical protein